MSERPPEARISISHPGPLTKDRDAGTDFVALIEIEGKIVGHLPYTKVKWEWDDPSAMPVLTFSTLAGRSNVSSRELRKK